MQSDYGQPGTPQVTIPVVSVEHRVQLAHTGANTGDLVGGALLAIGLGIAIVMGAKAQRRRLS